MPPAPAPPRFNGAKGSLNQPKRSETAPHGARHDRSVRLTQTFQLSNCPTVHFSNSPTLQIKLQRRWRVRRKYREGPLIVTPLSISRPFYHPLGLLPLSLTRNPYTRTYAPGL
eukprot:2267460-Pyramimonas_sp.AAC.1